MTALAWLVIVWGMVMLTIHYFRKDKGKGKGEGEE